MIIFTFLNLESFAALFFLVGGVFQLQSPTSKVGTEAVAADQVASLSQPVLVQPEIAQSNHSQPESLFALSPNASSASEPTLASAERLNLMPQISLTFDDGDQSVIEKAYPILKKYGLVGTAFIPTAYVGQHWNYAVNRESLTELTKDNRYMTWSELKQLKSSGWEIASHTKSHLLLELQSSEMVHEQIYASSTDLLSHGFQPSTFASPFGSYNPKTISEVSRYFSGHRGFWDRILLNSQTDRNDLILTTKSVEFDVDAEKMREWVSTAIKNHEWLILTFHIISDLPNPLKELRYTCTTALLEEFAKELHDLQAEGKIKVRTVTQAMSRPGKAIFMEHFSGPEKIVKRWQAAASSPGETIEIQLDHDDQGAFPDAKNSLKIISKSAFPAVQQINSKSFSVSSHKTIAFQGFINKTNLIGEGSVEVWIQELDSKGNALSESMIWKLRTKDYPISRFSVLRPLHVETAKARWIIRMAPSLVGSFILDEFKVTELR